MARIVSITVPPELADELIPEFDGVGQVAGIQRQRGASVAPPGDVLSVLVPNRSLHPLLLLLDRFEVGKRPGTSYTLSEPMALVERDTVPTLLRESTEAPWEEVEQLLARESNMTVNGLLLMAVAGALAAMGISTGALHIVIAAMVIAPGYEPLTRLALGLVAGGSAVRRGLEDTLKAYGSLLLGATFATLVLPALGVTPLVGPDKYLSSESLVSYWTSLEPGSLLLSLIAAAAGAILVSINQTVLTAGVMIGLALIPAAALAGTALVSGAPSLAGQALLRWALDVLLVLLASLAVLGWKHHTIQKGRNLD